jgi:hypothetical protein
MSTTEELRENVIEDEASLLRLHTKINSVGEYCLSAYYNK